MRWNSYWSPAVAFIFSCHLLQLFFFHSLPSFSSSSLATSFKTSNADVRFSPSWVDLAHVRQTGATRGNIANQDATASPKSSASSYSWTATLHIYATIISPLLTQRPEKTTGRKKGESRVQRYDAYAVGVAGAGGRLETQMCTSHEAKRTFPNSSSPLFLTQRNRLLSLHPYKEHFTHSFSPMPCSRHCKHSHNEIRDTHKQNKHVTTAVNSR